MRIDFTQLQGQATEAQMGSWLASYLKETSNEYDAQNRKIINLGAPTNPNDAVRLTDLQNLNIARKQFVRTIATTNLTLSGLQTVNGVSLVAGDHILCAGQTTASTRGIYVVASGSWTRRADADTGAELTGAIVFVDEGSANANTNWQQVNTITNIASDAQNWINVGGSSSGVTFSISGKELTANVTTADGQLATATTLPLTPLGYVEVKVNGVSQTVGNGVKTKDCYFSADSGVTAKALTSIASNDQLYWNGSIAGFELKSTFKIDFSFIASV